MDELYVDLLITDEDLTPDSGNQPILCNNRESIAQDIKHALLESGLVTALIGERSGVLRADIVLQMQLLIEEDERLIAGTVAVYERLRGDRLTLFISAQTVAFGAIGFEVIAK